MGAGFVLGRGHGSDGDVGRRTGLAWLSRWLSLPVQNRGTRARLHRRLALRLAEPTHGGETDFLEPIVSRVHANSTSNCGLPRFQHLALRRRARCRTATLLSLFACFWGTLGSLLVDCGLPVATSLVSVSSVLANENSTELQVVLLALGTTWLPANQRSRDFSITCTLDSFRSLMCTSAGSLAPTSVRNHGNTMTCARCHRLNRSRQAFDYCVLSS